MADAAHDRISATLLTSATWLDSFFGEETPEVEDNRTNLRVRYSSFQDADGHREYGPAARLRLVLPQLRDRLHLVLGGEREEDDPRRAPETDGRGDAEEPEEGDLRASLRYFVQAARRNNLSVRVGVPLAGIEPTLVVEPRYRAERDLGEWLLRFTQSARWSSRKGFGEKTRFDLETSVGDAALFRAVAEGVWQEEVAGYTYFLRLLLFQPLDAEKAVEYLWVNQFLTHPGHRLEDVVVAARYRQRVWREWLAFEVAPQFALERDNRFRPVPGIRLTLEATAGSVE